MTFLDGFSSTFCLFGQNLEQKEQTSENKKLRGTNVEEKWKKTEKNLKKKHRNLQSLGFIEIVCLQLVDILRRVRPKSQSDVACRAASFMFFVFFLMFLLFLMRGSTFRRCLCGCFYIFTNPPPTATTTIPQALGLAAEGSGK